MARENQGLQIGLIVVVVFAIGFAVSTYVLYRQWDEATVKAKSAQDNASKQADVATKNAADVVELKRLIGVAATESVDSITNTTFKDDMKNFGGAYPEEARFYHQMLEKMGKTIREKNADLEAAKAEGPKKDEEYKKREDARSQQVKQFQDAATKASQDLAGEQSKYKNERERINQENAKYQGDLKAARTSASESITRIENKLNGANDRIKQLLSVTEEATAKIAKLTTGQMGTPNGEIGWVNQRAGTVWINLGRADGLARQVTFSVYPADSNDEKTAKGGIEVTQILGDHLAEARILDSNYSDPIIPGDKIFTPLWAPGERRHFALAGLIDIDGDGRSDLETVLAVIRAGGGIVDCYIPDSGRDKNKVKGDVTVNTNLLIVGAAPDEKGEPAQRDAFTKIIREADQYRLQKVQLGDFLQRIGWKNLSPVVRYGRGANPNDFLPKSESEIPQKTIRNTSDVFKDREPPPMPTPGGRGSYYRY